MLSLLVLASWLFALGAPVLARVAPRWTGLLLGCGALAISAATVWMGLSAVGGEPVLESAAWVPQLGVDLSWRLDGWSLLFAALITGIGALIFIYAGSYFKPGDANLPRFYLFMAAFMASMLGLVLADNLLLLFVFWEATSITSFLLIGTRHGSVSTRAAALQALLVTTSGGLALLGGFVLLGQVAGSFELTALLDTGSLAGHDLFLAILLLVGLGAFAKSAQFPFHFWLPGAMAAPTPVSAYLHSATMVKAGVYLLGRLTPVLGGNEAWFWLLTAVGATTVVVGGVLALRQDDLKLVLAYSTVAALGLLVLLLGQGTTLAVKAAVVFLLAHALYKGALFMVAGAIDHAVHTRLVSMLGGLARGMPVTAVIACLAATSMIGVPPLFGFVAKEVVVEAALEGDSATAAGAILVFAALAVAAALLVTVRPFLGSSLLTDRAHEPSGLLLVGPGVLALLGIGLGFVPGVVAGPVAAAVGAIRGEAIAVPSLVLWHGWTAALVVSAGSMAIGVLLFVGRDWYLAVTGWVAVLGRLGPRRIYEAGLDLLTLVAYGQTRVLQNGYLRAYLLVVLVLTMALVISARVQHPLEVVRAPGTIALEALATMLLVVGGAVFTVFARRRLAAIIGVGIVGYGVALMYVVFSAPDAAMTQFLIETLTIVLFVLVLSRLPRFAALSDRLARLRDAAVAGAFGLTVTLLFLGLPAAPAFPKDSDFFLERSLPDAHGANVVNVILVDFRALDTLGEITVLALAAVGVVALIRLRAAVER